MKITNLYEEIIKKLKEGKRPLIKLDESLKAELLEEFKKANNSKDKGLLMKCLCILDNTQSLCPKTGEEILKAISQSQDSDEIIFCLSAMQKHIIEYKFRDGQRLNMNELNTISKLLDHESPEVLEWSLRVIESIGPQGLFFKSKIFEKKPGILGILNKHKKASRQIIEMLEKRWDFSDKI